MSADEVQPVAGATPPWVLSRWTKVTSASLSPPIGPMPFPTAVNLSQATEFCATKSGSVTDVAESPAFAWAQTALESRESCHVARIVPLADNAGLLFDSKGFGLKKWVMICSSPSLDNVASGVNRTNATPLPDGRQT